MAGERTTKINGVDFAVIGTEIRVGQKAPEFTGSAPDWSRVQALESSKGMVRVLAAAPSLETSVCDRETRRFNVEAANLSSDVRIFVISADLPYTQKRWCGAAGVDRVVTLSDNMEAEFGTKYGCLIKARRILSRAVFVVGRDDKVVYAAYMPALGDEPDYEAVLAAARSAL
ncbi:MAG TPA: thiol peroxidase [Anaerolineales bacterium]|nr:thiol peroxidase [Anaerolineales bacterium]